MALSGLTAALTSSARPADAELHWDIFPWVLLGTLILMLFVRLLGSAALAIEAARARPSRKRTVLESPVLPGIDPELMAVISAVIAVHEPGPHRIVSVRHHATEAHEMEQSAHQWSLEGRRQIYTSHKVR